MSTKISIDLEQSIFEKANNYASANGSSLEDLIINYLKLVAAKNDKDTFTLTAIARSLKGVVHSTVDIGQLINEELEKNHQQ